MFAQGKAEILSMLMPDSDASEDDDEGEEDGMDSDTEGSDSGPDEDEDL